MILQLHCLQRNCKMNKFRPSMNFSLYCHANNSAFCYDKTLSWHHLPVHEIFPKLTAFDIAYYPGVIVIDHLRQHVCCIHRQDSAWEQQILAVWSYSTSTVAHHLNP